MAFTNLIQNKKNYTFKQLRKVDCGRTQLFEIPTISTRHICMQSKRPRICQHQLEISLT